MAYSTAGEKRVNHYSSPDIMFSGHPTGTEENDNARALSEVRFAVANIGDEAMECPVELSNKALDTSCSDRYRSCFMVSSSCWDPLIASGCPTSCGLCPNMVPRRSNTCYNRISHCNDLVRIGGCQDRKVRRDCKEACGGCV